MLPPLPRWLEDGSSRPPRGVGIYVSHYIASYKSRQYSSLPDIQITRLYFYIGLNTTKMHQKFSLYLLIRGLNKHFSKQLYPFERHCLLGCATIQRDNEVPVFRRNIFAKPSIFTLKQKHFFSPKRTRSSGNIVHMTII